MNYVHVNDKCEESSLLSEEMSHQWGQRLRNLRQSMGVGQEEMGRALGVTREWISKLEREKEEVSELLQLKIQQLESSTDEKLVHNTPKALSFDMVVGRPQFESVAQLVDRTKQRIDDHMHAVLRAAGNDPDRLGYVRNMLEIHLQIPEQWRHVEHVLSKVAETERLLRKQDMELEKGAPAREHNSA